MSLQLKYASHPTLLLDDLVETLRTPTTKPGELIPVLMPSVPLVERAKVTLARRHGIAMGISFLLPDAFIERIAALVELEPLHPSWRPDGLRWCLLSCLAAMVSERRYPRLEAVCVDSRSQMALAREVADRFNQYIYFRPEMIAAWRCNTRWGDLPDIAEEDEGWQKELWRRVTEGLQKYPDPARRLEELARRLDAGEGTLSGRLEVLATGPLPPIILPLLRALAGRTTVCLRALLPSTEYLGDIRAARSQMRAGTPVDLAWEGHPLLAHLGKQAIESFQSFDSALVDGGQEYDVLPLPELSSETLLQQVQSDIRAARQPGEAEGFVLDPDTDRSVRFHRCHGPRREIEVVRDALLDAFAELPDLRANEVLVMAPDLESYGPLAEAIFREAVPALPLRLSERRVDRSDQVVRAMKAMLHFAGGRAPLSEGLALLELPVIASHVESLDGDVESLKRQLRSAGITWGLDAAHRRGLNAGEAMTGTWRGSLDRLLAGLWFGQCRDACDTDGHPALPVANDLGDAPESVTAVLDWLDGLLKCFEQWQDEASPAEWAARLDLALDAVVVSDDGRFDTIASVELIDELRKAEEEHGCVEPLSVGAVADWLERLVAEEGRTVARVGGEMAMGGFKPLRAIPCRVLVLMGMHESAFPRKSRSPAWDLLAVAPRPSDRDPLRDDRQLFLDAILATKERVIVTASARNIRTDQEEPFSACVDAFVRVAARTASSDPDVQKRVRQDLVVSHRLQPFHQSYFSQEKPSFDGRHMEVAKALRKDAVKETWFARSVDPGADVPVVEDLELQHLIRDLKNPWKRWLQSLQVVLPQAADDPQALDRDLITAPTGLDQWHVLRDVIESTRANHGEYLEEQLAADRRLPYGRLGEAMGRKVMELGRTMVDDARQAANGALVPHSLAYRLCDPSVVGTVYLNEAQSVHVIVVPGDLQTRPKYRLEAWVTATFAFAVGLDVATVVVSRQGSASRVDRMPAIGEATAQSSLDRLLELWHRAGCGLIPFKPNTSAAIFKASCRGDDLREKAQGEWEKKWNGIPGDGDDDSAKLVWRGQDPFSGPLMEEWQGLASDVFGRVEKWNEGRNQAQGDIRA